MPTNQSAHAGQAVYNRKTLKLYDWFVLGISNQWIWKCPTNQLLNHYYRHISDHHLDVGVGTGYFLDRCKFPTDSPSITLLDLNADSLAATAARIARYRPQIHQANALEPIHLDNAPFKSIGINYLLHCLPGSLPEKAIIFDHLNANLAPDGRIFGSTLLQGGVSRNPLARQLMAFYNRKGIFSNANDRLEALRDVLATRYEVWEVQIIGCAAVFSASKPKSHTAEIAD